MESILNTIKKMLGIESDYDAFDVDIITNINSVFMTLNSLGVGPKEGFSISGADETWDQFTGDTKKMNAVRSYVYLRVKLLFDPPTSSFVLESMKQQADEFGWRLHMYAEYSTEGADERDE